MGVNKEKPTTPADYTINSLVDNDYDDGVGDNVSLDNELIEIPSVLNSTDQIKLIRKQLETLETIIILEIPQLQFNIKVMQQQLEIMEKK